MSFVGGPSHCGLYWNEISHNLAEQGAMKNMSQISHSNLCYFRLSHETASVLEKTLYTEPTHMT